MQSSTSSSLDKNELRSRFPDLFTPQTQNGKPFVHGFRLSHLGRPAVLVSMTVQQSLNLASGDLVLASKAIFYESFLGGSMVFMEVSLLKEEYLANYLDLLDKLPVEG
jgi:hypothetical protein